MTTPDAATTAAPLGAKPKKWAHGGEVPTFTLPNGQIAELCAALGLAYDASLADYVNLTLDHTTGGLKVSDAGPGKTLKSASFSLSATGTAVTAVSSKRLKVYAVKLVCSAAISVNFRDGAASNLEGAQAVAANSGFVETVTPPAFLFATAAGNSLDLVISGTGTAAGRISYWDDDAT